MTEREAKYLGAFLHDIGKFSYRAEDIRVDHETRGESFFKCYLQNFRIINNDNIIINNIISSLKRSIGKTKEADISISKEREEEEKNSRKTRRPLISIFSRVDIGKPSKDYFEKYEKQGIYYHNPEPLEFKTSEPINESNKNIYSWELTAEEEKKFIELHKKSYDLFTQEVKRLNNIEDFRAFFTSFYKICEKYTSKVCSAGYTSIPDISLFDHSRLVAAISICIDEGDKDKECLLIKGDVSGIQNFIYHQISDIDKAAKQLRGRSFYIRLLSDAIANYITRELHLYDANILISSGGHFIILAPNNQANREKIKVLETRINRVLLNNFGGILQVIIAHVDSNYQEVGNKFYEVHFRLDEELQKAKKHKSLSILEDILSEPKEQEEDKDKKENLFEEIGKRIVHSNYLLEINYESQEKKNYLGNLDTEIIDFSEFGLSYIFANRDNLLKTLGLLEQHAYNNIIIYNLKETSTDGIFDILKNNKNQKNIGVAYKFVGSYIPTKEYKPLTFEELSKLNSSSYPLLGVARMDVDSLGAIFALGLKQAKQVLEEKKVKEDKGNEENKEEDLLYSISRIATLSRELDHFFCGNINKIAKKHDVYLVYSGGDDLFAVGSWINIIEFVRDVRKTFGRFVCDNKNITISCGTVFVKPFYPVSRFAIEAGNQEKAAKEKYTNKDMISLFYREISWEELERQMLIGKYLLDIVKEEDGKKALPRSFIHTLLSLTQQCFDNDGKFDMKIVHKIVPKLHYAFARRDINYEQLNNEKNIKSDKDLMDKIDSNKGIPDEENMDFKRVLARYFIESDIEDKKSWYENFQIPASYVLLKTRKLNK